MENPEQQVLSAYEAVAEQTSLLLGQHEDLSGRFSEAFKHSSSLTGGMLRYQRVRPTNVGFSATKSWADAC